MQVPRGVLYLRIAAVPQDDHYGLRKKVGFHKEGVIESAPDAVPREVDLLGEAQGRHFWLREGEVPRQILPRPADPQKSWPRTGTWLVIQYDRLRDAFMP
jgi:hypothetical protein